MVGESTVLDGGISNDPDRVLLCFRCFDLRFWNHTRTCASLRPSLDARASLSEMEIDSSLRLIQFRPLLSIGQSIDAIPSI